MAAELSRLSKNVEYSIKHEIRNKITTLNPFAEQSMIEEEIDMAREALHRAHRLLIDYSDKFSDKLPLLFVESSHSPDKDELLKRSHVILAISGWLSEGKASQGWEQL